MTIRLRRAVTRDQVVDLALWRAAQRVGLASRSTGLLRVLFHPKAWPWVNRVAVVFGAVQGLAAGLSVVDRI